MGGKKKQQQQQQSGNSKGGKGKQPVLTRKERAKLEQEQLVAAKAERKKENQVRGAIKRARERGKWRTDDMDCRKEMAAFGLQLAGLGLKIRAMVGDGNCLFRSLADQLMSNAAKHVLVRQLICEHMEKHRDCFEPFVEDDKPWARYISEMRKESCWGGNLELQAASVHFEINITIHQLGEPMWQVVNWPLDSGKRMIHISYHDGDHYNCVYEMTPTELDPVLRAQAAEVAKQREQLSGTATADEEIIMHCTGCFEVDLVRKLLNRCHKDTDTVIDILCTVSTDLGKDWRDEVIEVMLKDYARENPNFKPVPSSSTGKPESSSSSSTSSSTPSSSSTSSSTPSSSSSSSSTPSSSSSSSTPSSSSSSTSTKKPTHSPTPAKQPNAPPRPETNRERKIRLALEKEQKLRDKKNNKLHKPKEDLNAPVHIPKNTLGALAI